MPDPAAHAKDCAPCDAARAVVAALREDFDPLENWDEVEVEGESVTTRTIATVAEVLHRYPLGGKARRG
ncbi:hypothetical protein [Amycolatopsis tolypomycina]|uniref:hypothetical protein n=1 Tax=Amycolatopsis tolypomycina TaxID=208445 RepID=UPI0033AB75DD